METIRTTTCSRTYRVLRSHMINSGVCIICWRRSGRTDTGCNGIKDKKTKTKLETVSKNSIL